MTILPRIDEISASLLRAFHFHFSGITLYFRPVALRPLFILLLLAVRVVASAPDALPSPSEVALHFDTDGQGQILVTATNRTSQPKPLVLRAGFTVASPENVSLVAIQETRVSLPPGATSELTIPALATGRTPLSPGAALQPSTPHVGTLQPLLTYAGAHPDLPRATAQLTAWLLSENLRFPDWRAALGHEPSPTDIATAIDALGIAQQLQPSGRFAFADDPELRLRALRHPLTRDKAMQVLGTAAPEGVPVPDIGQLFHTRPGDNCPICRMRAQAEQSGNGL